MELDSIIDYLPPEVIDAPNYWGNIEGMRIQGLIMAVCIAAIVIFKIHDKLKAPTEKPAKRDKTVIQNILEMFNDLKYALLAKMVYTVEFLISLKKKKPSEKDDE